MAPRIVAICILACVAAARADDRVDFTHDVQPILADNCYFCHGPDGNKRKADLRLDTLDPKLGPFAARDGYSILVPGKLDDSVLIMRITSDDPDAHMPPAKANRHLSDRQIDVIKRWVEQGARLEKQGLVPSAEASKETLIRRVTLDLTGLGPTPEEVDAFVNDPSSDAYEKVVDRLLASSRYGEHMAWAWLDLSRYADTNGYQADPTRTMWPWRDWVVKAINANMPFDQFATWQLAGDE